MKHKTSRNVVRASNDLSTATTATQPVTDSLPVSPVTDDEQRTELRGQYLRLAADFDNFRKRTHRDAAQQAAAGKNAFIHDLLPIVDNLERALVCDRTNVSGQLHQGVEMTLRQLGQLLHRHGIEAVEDVGHPFDAHRHEAISARNDPTRPDDCVLEVMQRGYGCGENIFRPAMVVVNDWHHSSGVAHAG